MKTKRRRMVEIEDPDTGEIVLVPWRKGLEPGEQVEPKPPAEETPKVRKADKDVLPSDWRPEYYACNNNLVILNEGLRRHVSSGLLNGSSLCYFFGFGAKAQCQKGPIIKYQSEQALIRSLGLNVRQRERDALQKALKALQKMVFDIPRFYHWGKTKRRRGMTDPDWTQYQRELKEQRTWPCRFERILQVRHRLDGRISMKFCKKFLKATSGNGFFTTINLKVARKLRRPHVMLLHLLLGAKDNLIEWKPGVIAMKIGLREKRPDRILSKMRKAAKRIAKVTGQKVRVTELSNGLLRIRRNESDNQ